MSERRGNGSVDSIYAEFCRESSSRGKVVELSQHSSLNKCCLSVSYLVAKPSRLTVGSSRWSISFCCNMYHNPAYSYCNYQQVRRIQSNNIVHNVKHVSYAASRRIRRKKRRSSLSSNKFRLTFPSHWHSVSQSVSQLLCGKLFSWVPYFLHHFHQLATHFTPFFTLVLTCFLQQFD